MKDVVTPVAPEEVRAMIQTSLENAALLNYTQLSQKANIEGKEGSKSRYRRKQLRNKSKFSKNLHFYGGIIN